MENETRVIFERYAAQIAKLNGVPSVEKSFSVAPSIAQTMEEKIRESSDFLQRINSHPVKEVTAEKVGLDSGTTLASTTDTDKGDRQTTSPFVMDNMRYTCTETDYDSHIPWDYLDRWAKDPKFQARLRNIVLNQIGRDRLMMGWNGTHRAENSDRTTYPLLQDVNVGFLEKIRKDKPENAVEGIKVGDKSGNDYRNIDALVTDMVANFIAEWYQEDTRLVAIVGRALLDDKYLTLVNNYDEPSEQQPLNMLMTNKKVGALPAYRVPFFPSRSILVTRFDNLSHYWQKQSKRRHITENAKRRRIEDYQSVKESFEVEDYDLVGLAEDLVLPDGQGGWA